MPEIGLGIDRFRRTFGSVQREVLYWYDEQRSRLLAPDELLQIAQQQLEQYRQRFGDLPSEQVWPFLIPNHRVGYY